MRTHTPQHLECMCAFSLQRGLFWLFFVAFTTPNLRWSKFIWCHSDSNSPTQTCTAQVHYLHNIWWWCILRCYKLNIIWTFDQMFGCIKLPLFWSICDVIVLYRHILRYFVRVVQPFYWYFVDNFWYASSITCSSKMWIPKSLKFPWKLLFTFFFFIKQTHTRTHTISRSLSRSYSPLTHKFAQTPTMGSKAE